jgi:hypothetical protein
MRKGQGSVYDKWNIFVIYIIISHKPFVIIIKTKVFSIAIVLSVLRYTDSDYPFGIFELFLHDLGIVNIDKPCQCGSTD